jgi:hypothetical protein
MRLRTMNRIISPGGTRAPSGSEEIPTKDWTQVILLSKRCCVKVDDLIGEGGGRKVRWLRKKKENIARWEWSDPLEHNLEPKV